MKKNLNKLIAAQKYDPGKIFTYLAFVPVILISLAGLYFMLDNIALSRFFLLGSLVFLTAVILIGLFLE